MRFGILGPVEARREDGATVSVGGARLRGLLALLALDAGRIVPTERLIEGLYGERPVTGEGNALQSQISRLRRSLDVPVEFHPAGYRLVVDGEEVDAHRFERLVRQGRAAESAAVRSELLGQALALWRGPALADVREVPFAPAQAARLEELRVDVTEDRVEADLELGRHRELVTELQRLVEAHPVRERLRGQLIRALYASGRQAEALTAFEDARRTLADELGVDPSPELREIHLAALRGELYAPAAPGRTEPQDRTAGVRSALPAQLTSFVGRQDDLAEVARLLERARLVTLTGPGGAGKTRLALEAAAAVKGEVGLVELDGVAEGGDVAQAVLTKLGLRIGQDAPDPADRLVAALAGRRMLLVLDNCEHVVAAAAELAHRLLSACPDLRVLATGREGPRHHRREHLARDRAARRARGAAVRGQGRRGPPGVRARRGQPRRRAADLPGARRAAAGDRAGRGQAPLAARGGGSRQAGGRARAAVARQPYGPAQAPHAARGGRVELEPAG
ncbi:AfsR/SARP family transcriptional regulator [Nonomuraea dietziae]|uniref:AfsR/SARP family transcriptional regulator n=1 Tax=Nonomuraea dietziae TaxID=65515 RepID=UPI0031D5E46D